ncbi:NHLP family bacteriocin export ABC transporter peptidase/permease/ATPase subunit [Bradyrhizobium manausense]|uniref:NHLP family bacteriocin export ABC transporter peptidase/permease/ATPase subunit n=1 Tax=Bradyrhizobium manausense TaxID=989370 RepID=UPI001BA8AE7C|nr:NHLP family bacteriocin export ABC transporter peptidase/permease/ATPase subunit [Bradyrhizobium manausense]MBR0685350.1 NHLP family bacteriocin export ABC transporter peptidase/permease/ATPase subunit [Bradyrhizobium manausense]MBR0721302.1 NHLP family bacteriocin export ABC transporter peptidase/permease/ATPase subunit [Bradyrhizobium manausense]
MDSPGSTTAGIKRTPTILQMEAAECGAACLAMVLAHYGAWVPLERLRVECGVSRDGSKASNVVRAAKRFGLSAKGFRLDLAALGSAPTPCIIHWNFNHFVVLEGIKGRSASINDPAFGRRQVGVDELDRSFTGVVLTFEPAPGFVPTGDKPAGLRLLLRELRGSKAAVGLLILLSFVMVVPGLVAASFSKIFIDDILIQHLNGWLRPLLIGMAATALIRTILTLLQQSLLLRLQTKLSVVMISRFLWRVMALPIEFFTQRHAGDIAARVGANDQIARLLAGGIAANALSLTSVVFFAFAMIVYDHWLAAVCISLSLLNVLTLRLSMRRREDLSRGLSLERGKLLGAVVSIVRSIETIKASGLEDEAFAQWSGVQAKVLNAERDLASSSILLDMIPTLISGMTMTAILILGGLRVIEGSLTLGSLVAFQALMASFSEPVATLVNQAGSFQLIKGALDRLEDVYNYPLGDKPRASDNAFPARLDGRIEFKDVQFGYSLLEPPLISDLSITVTPGSRVALVGASGSGKSTLGRLVCGLYKPWAGEILIDGTRLEEVPPDILANSIAYVDQDIFLFEGTIRDNLTLWDRTTPDIDLTRALKDGEIQDDIAIRAGNYDSYVNEGGTNFSGGQRQRIEIARALVGRPSIVVLDEATAALDPVTEKAIDDNLRRCGCTCIIIAHRLSTIRDCDEIVVLRQGKVAERGTHETLLALNGEYARLVSQE